MNESEPVLAALSAIYQCDESIRRGRERIAELERQLANQRMLNEATEKTKTRWQHAYKVLHADLVESQK